MMLHLSSPAALRPSAPRAAGSSPVAQRERQAFGQALPSPRVAPLSGAAAALSTAAALRRVGRRSRGGSRGGESQEPQVGGATFVLPRGQAKATPEQQAEYLGKEGCDLGDERWQINLLYDGDCQVCSLQVEFLTKRMDENPEYAGLVRLTNLADPAYDAEACGGVAFEDGMRHIHAVTRDGDVITGVECLRHVYRTVGMEWVYALTSLPLLGGAFDWLYDRWAENRLWLTGRGDALKKVHEHQKKIEEMAEQECDTECEIDWD